MRDVELAVTTNPSLSLLAALTNFNGGTISTANVGLSSYQGSDGNRLLAAQGRLITAHEIGHNWGSEHDPTSPIGPCNPQLSNDAGKFLMFPSMSDGTQNNNDVFSGCSLDMVADVLRAKSQNCFSSKSCPSHIVIKGSSKGRSRSVIESTVAFEHSVLGIWEIYGLYAP